ncbi:ecto-ADP-ribosyltransferase 5-like [Labeo rohita]|uniref:ecto-ADP-ribosyltransferase 5-like n=1 Tax=Labeo rohita TaxID=84645 RepID=UPI0021E1F378|nr:ecto-ADP-ribosyltransferase 5-like [Labeo rohita]XP_050957608.1 ecto-ADP-ribosyltransferase 5-like [Labeo rohita]XP_050957609.1 ecto-ADP-ribosyltransferase 5-like [Labeo rohita]XP_050957610.1 ecto-ADP-ribosyltransferase 5-like [Labeo rohita]
MKMLLIIEALLILAALGQDHRAAAAVENTFPLDMAPNSVDDQYKGCENEMEDKVENYYLEQERSASAEFNKAWQEGEENAKKAEGSLTQNHSIAIYVYTNKDSTVYSNFTSATRTDKQKYEEGAFKWYSLHFLLTEAIQTLKKTQNRCYVTYRGTNVKFDVQSIEVRLSSFSSSSLDRKVIQGFGNVSCFEIYTCEGADLTKYSKYPEEKEVLIPPYETFIVTDVKNRTDQPDLWCETVFMLNSTGKSDLSCALFNSGNHAAFCNILLILQILVCKVFTC